MSIRTQNILRATLTDSLSARSSINQDVVRVAAATRDHLGALAEGITLDEFRGQAQSEARRRSSGGRGRGSRGPVADPQAPAAIQLRQVDRALKDGRITGAQARAEVRRIEREDARAKRAFDAAERQKERREEANERVGGIDPELGGDDGGDALRQQEKDLAEPIEDQEGIEVPETPGLDRQEAELPIPEPNIEREAFEDRLGKQQRRLDEDFNHSRNRPLRPPDNFVFEAGGEGGGIGSEFDTTDTVFSGENSKKRDCEKPSENLAERKSAPRSRIVPPKPAWTVSLPATDGVDEYMIMTDGKDRWVAEDVVTKDKWTATNFNGPYTFPGQPGVEKTFTAST